MTVQALQVPMMGTNCYLLKDDETGKGAIIDPGGAGDAIADAVEKMEMIPVAIFLTHGHYDHSEGIPALVKRFPNVPVYLHAADAVQTQKVDSLMPNIGETVPYDEGDQIEIGSLTALVYHTPGHTAGSVTIEVGEALFTGDTMFAGNCGRTDLPSGSPDQMAQSLKRLANLEGDRQVLPGHEEFSTLEKERVSNYWVLYALKH